MTDAPWQPSASIDTLKQRAAILATIRQFFAEREVLEVETPLLARYSVTDPHMDVLTADNPLGGEPPYYLQTSPEYAMKRLLAAGSGAIYQLCKAFRRGETSSRHNPEFTMLEWYRPGFSLLDLMAEIEALLKTILGDELAVQRISYQQLFMDHLQFDPLQADSKTVEAIARQHLDIQMHSDCVDDWLNLLMAEVIEPQLKPRGAVFVYQYPASQAALSRIERNQDGVPVAQRFELYVDGLELANGYAELTDAEEQRQRFMADQAVRAAQAKPHHEVDEFLLSAVSAGLPPCSGVALGLDRLIMRAIQASHITQVLAFSVDKA